METIEYEEALEREVEYAKSMKMRFQSPSPRSVPVPSNSEVLPSKPCLSGTKRKTSSSFPQLQLEEFHQPLQCVPPSLPHEDPSSINTIVWCSLCKVPCMSPLNFEQHLQGKKHKAEWYKAFGSNKKSVNPMVHCSECNIWCMDEVALAQHRAGKNHAARLLTLGLGLGSNKKSVNPMVDCSECNIWCMDEVALAQHRMGKNHAARLLTLRLGLGSNNDVGPNGKKEFKCTECEIWCTDETTLSQHFVGKKHAARLLRLQHGLG